MYHKDGSQLTWIIWKHLVKIPSSSSLASFGDSTIGYALPKQIELYVIPLVMCLFLVLFQKFECWIVFWVFQHLACNYIKLSY